MQELFEYLVDPDLFAYISLISIFNSFYICEESKPKVMDSKKLGIRLEDVKLNELYH